MKAFCLFILGVILVACNTNKGTYQKSYLDFDSLISRQQQLLLRRNGVVVKIAQLDGKPDTSSFARDSIALARELDIFRQLDLINRPLYKKQYQVTEEADPKSNLTVRVYRSKISAPINEIRFYFLDRFDNLKKIESSYEEQNTLYYTKRHYQLDFMTIGNQNLISKATTTGIQKMILRDSLSFQVITDFGLTP